MAGAEGLARHFPFRIGRAPASDWRLDEDGVWDSHLEIACRAGEGFVLSVQSGALASVNGQSVQTTVLRNGDLIEVGAAQIRFALGPARLRGLRLREALTWGALAALCLGQVALIYWLLD